MITAESVNEIRKTLDKITGNFVPQIGIILGSGLGSLADSIDDKITVPYVSLPGFPPATALGHAGNFIFGRLGGKNVVAMQGRYHYYEGYGSDTVVLPIRIMIALGIKVLLVSNATGSTKRQNLKIGDIMIIRDHISLIPNPLIGHNEPEFGPRFPDMTRPYDPALIQLAHQIANSEDIEVKEGVYLAVTGPSFETIAEYKFFNKIGADTVGMSIAPEVIAARQSDIPCFGVNVITDLAPEYGSDYTADPQEIIEAANKSAAQLKKLFTKLIEKI